MKKVGKYITISFLLLLGLGCVGVLYLFFIPNSSLFGISYVNNHDTITSLSYDKSLVTQVTLNSKSYDVEITPTDKSVISVEVFSNSFGFVLSETEDAKITSSLNNGILVFDVIEPTGLALQNNSYVKLYLPETYDQSLNLSNNNAETTINSEKVKIENLTYKTKNGNFFFNKGTITGTLNLTLNNSRFTINSDVQTSSANNVDLKLTTGKFYAEHSNLGEINIKQNKRGIISIKECTKIYQNSSTAGGQLKVSKLQNINVKTGDTIINLGEVTHGATITATKSGKVRINHLKEYSTIITNTGDIKILKCENKAVVHTNKGDINVKSAKETVSVKTKYGNVNIAFDETIANYDGTNDFRVLHANIYNGKLTATGVDHIGVADDENPENILGIKVTGNGRINLRMNNVYGDNAISGKRGNVSVVVNMDKNPNYLLTTASKSGKVRVNLMQTTSFNGYTTKDETTTPVNCYTSNNTLKVTTTSGDIVLLDSQMYQMGF